MTITQTGRRVALVGLLALIGALLPFTGASAIDGDEALELSGDSNTAVSIANSEVVYTPLGEDGPDNPPTNVLIGREDVFADNLASGSLQGAAAEGDNGAPLLLTGSDELDADVQAEIERLGATSVTILGGTAAISEDVETALGEIEGVDSVERLEGATRTETAIAVAGASGADTALLVRSGAAGDDATQAFADSLGAGALAATNGYSILFTQTEVLTGSTAEYLASDDAPSSVIIVGGTAAISEDTEAEVVEILGEDAVSRVSGPTRFDTAVALNGLRDGDLGSYAIAVDGQGDDAWADGFSMANLSGLNNAPLVLTNQGGVPEATETYLESINDNDARAHLTNVFVVCGSTAAGDACAALAEAFGLTVVPWPPADPEPEPANSGVVIDTDAPGGSYYEFQPADGSDAVTVMYVAEDSYSVDGIPATMAAFDAALSVGDQVTYTEENEDGEQTHDLTNAEPVEEGTVGFVDVNATSFEIIEPVSGAIIGAGTVDYSADCDLFTVDGAPTTDSIFGENISIGDMYTFDEAGVAPSTVTTCNLENGSVGGSAQSVDILSDVTPFEAEFEIGNVGDVYDNTIVGAFGPSDPDQVFFVEENVPDQEFTVDGETADIEDFVGDLSEGDDVTYDRTDGIETFTLVNVSPDTTTGESTENSSTGGNSLELVTEAGAVTETYGTDPDTRFIVDGVLGLEADFEGDLTPGDLVSYTPEDTAAGTPETVSLTNQPLDGTLDNVDIGATASNTPDGTESIDIISDVADVALVTGVDYTAEDFGTGAPLRYFVDGSEVDLASFEEALDDLDTDEGSISVGISALAVSYQLTTGA